MFPVRQKLLEKGPVNLKEVIRPQVLYIYKDLVYYLK